LTAVSLRVPSCHLAFGKDFSFIFIFFSNFFSIFAYRKQEIFFFCYVCCLRGVCALYLHTFEMGFFVEIAHTPRFVFNFADTVAAPANRINLPCIFAY